MSPQVVPPPKPKRNGWVAVSLITIIVVVGVMYAYSRYTAPLSEDADISTITLSYNAGDLDRAIALGESMITSEPVNIEALLALSATYAQKGSVAFDEENYAEKAIEVANKVLVLDPNNSEAHRIIGYANEIMGKYEEARVHYDKAIVADSNNSQAYSNKGHSYDLNGDLDNAGIWYDKALEVDSSNEHALLNKARLLVRQMKFADAKIVLNNLFATSKSNRFLAEGYQILAFIEMNTEDSDAESDYYFGPAYDALEKSIALDPNIPQVWVNLGLLDLKSLYFAESEDEVMETVVDIKSYANKALAINPNQASAYFLLSQVAVIEGNDVEVANYRQLGIKAVPNDITLGERERVDMLDTLSTEIDIKSTNNVQ